MEKIVTNKREKLAYGLGDFGCGLMWTFLGSFITLYYTDSVMLSAGFAGTMMLISRIADGVSDVLMGFIIEKTNTKYGKARPWFGITIIPLCLVFFLMFSVPDMGMTGKMVYAFVTYFLFTVVMYTANNLSYHAMLSRISSDQLDQVKISTVRSILTTFATGIATVCTSMMLSGFGGEKLQSAWTKVALIYVAISVISMAICFFVVKEKAVGQESVEHKTNTQIWGELKILLKYKYFYYAILFLIIGNIVSTTMMSTGVYYARDVLGDEGYYSLLALTLIAATIPGMLATPKIVERIGKRRSLILSCIITILGCCIGIVNPGSATLALASIAVRSVGTAITTAQLFTLAPDIIATIAKEKGVRLEGLATAANSFGAKIGAGLGSAILGWALELAHYDATAAAQSAAVIQAEIIILFWLPLVLTGISLVISALWDIGEA